MNRSKLFQALCGVVLLAGASQATFACSATPENGMIEISELPAYINEPGNYCLQAVEGSQYSYNSPDYGSAIYVNTDFATIDLNGQTITNVGNAKSYGFYYEHPRSSDQGKLTVSNGTLEGFDWSITVLSDTGKLAEVNIENINVIGSGTGIYAQGLHGLLISNADLKSTFGIHALFVEAVEIKNAKIQSTAHGIELYDVHQSLIDGVDISSDTTYPEKMYLGITNNSSNAGSIMNINNIRGDNMHQGISYGVGVTGLYSKTFFTDTDLCYSGGTKGKLNVCRRTQ